MENISIRKATTKDKAFIVEIDIKLNAIEHIELKREEKIAKAILNESCFIILSDHNAVGFVVFDYRFFDQGWIELVIVDEKYRGKGIAGKVFDLICNQCKTDKVFTSTNNSNTQMQKALNKAGFSFSGKLNGLDEGDPELFYYRKTKSK